MRTYASIKTSRNRQGIALILMLGMLSMILLLAVAFATTMRTERLAARNYADLVAARNLVHVGVGNAMQQIDSDMISARRVYPPWIGGSDESKSPGAPDYSGGFLSYKTSSDFAEDWLWIPLIPSLEKLVGAGSIAALTNATARAGQWVEVFDKVPAPNEVIGRYAYVVFNSSGLLDANVVAEAAARDYGHDPAEIRADSGLLAELGGKDLQTERDSVIRFETPSELNTLLTDGFYKSIYPYSYYPTNRLDHTGRPVDFMLDLGTNGIKKISQNQADFMRALEESGVASQLGRQRILVGLLDYVDTDHEPGSLKHPCVEKIPMLNEIYAKIDVNSSVPLATNSVIGVNLVTEAMRTFVDDPPGGLSHSVQLSYTVVMEPYGVGGTSIGSATEVTPPPPSFTSDGSIGYQPVQQGGSVSANYTHPTTPISEWSVIVRDLKLEISGTVVDQVFGDLELLRVSATGAPGASYRAIECLDPRFNWDPAQWAITTNTSDASMGKINQRTKDFFADEGNDADGVNLPDDQRVLMYVRDDDLENVGELGYLPYAPWKTIRLYDYDEADKTSAGTHQEPHRIYDHFFMADNVKQRGYVNVQSDSAAALASVWADMPVNDYPGESSPGTVSIAQATNVGRQVVTDRSQIAPSISTPSDVGVSIGKLIKTNVISEDTEFKREAFVRNAAELLRLRQNLFAILVIAQSGKESDGKFIRAAESKAVAVVWRDPVLPATGKADPPRPDSEGMFVRAFKWLDD